jgi:hypothetical protein
MPIEIPAILEFLDQPGRIESVLRLPEFLHDEAADACLIERPCGEHAEIVDVTRLVALIAGANFFGENFRQRETDDLCRREPQQLEITLPDLRQALGQQRRRLAPPDLELDFADAAPDATSPRLKQLS